MPEIPASFAKVVSVELWSAWSETQQAYVLSLEGGTVRAAFYSGKKWQFDKARPDCREICPKCSFNYCFYAMPRNYTIGDADVYNLMKCGNVNCQHEFVSCL